MAQAYPASDPIQSTFYLPGGNIPGTGVQVFCYLNKTTTKQSVYKDANAGAAWSNPIVLDSGGNLPSGGEVYILQGKTMTFVYAPANDTDPPASPYRTLNDMQGCNDPVAAGTSASALFGEWVLQDTPIYVSPSSFLWIGDYTADAQADIGRRVKATVTAGTVYGYIHDRAFAAGSTTVNIVPDVGQQLDAGMSTVWWGVLSAKNASMPYGVTHGWERPLSVASSVPVFSSGISENILLTGTSGAITQFDAFTRGQIRYIRASSGGFTIVHNASSIIVPTSSTLTVNQNDTFTALSLGNGVTFIKDYTRFNGQALVSGGGATTTLHVNRKYFTTATATTTQYTPPANIQFLHVEVIGAGGGGCGVGSSAAYVFGADGGTSWFGSNGIFILNANGGSGGQDAGGGSGGVVTAGSGAFGIRIAGNQGGNGMLVNLGTASTTGGLDLPGGAGACAVYGGGGAGQTSFQPANAPHSGSGSGGSGGGSTSSNVYSGGGGGAGGYIAQFVTSFAITWNYNVGAGGKGGTSAGMAGFSKGLNGADGMVVIDEYYLA